MKIPSPCGQDTIASIALFPQEERDTHQQRIMISSSQVRNQRRPSHEDRQNGKNASYVLSKSAPGPHVSKEREREREREKKFLVFSSFLFLLKRKTTKLMTVEEFCLIHPLREAQCPKPAASSPIDSFRFVCSSLTPFFKPPPSAALLAGAGRFW
jgi:hypothetical protein